jgi:hypothetical protein
MFIRLHAHIPCLCLARTVFGAHVIPCTWHYLEDVHGCRHGFDQKPLCCLHSILAPIYVSTSLMPSEHLTRSVQATEHHAHCSVNPASSTQSSRPLPPPAQPSGPSSPPPPPPPPQPDTPTALRPPPPTSTSGETGMCMYAMHFGGAAATLTSAAFFMRVRSGRQQVVMPL